MRYVVLVLSLAVGFISGGTILSYAIQWPPLRTWADPPMALNTALCLFFLSLSTALLAKGEEK